MSDRDQRDEKGDQTNDPKPQADDDDDRIKDIGTGYTKKSRPGAEEQSDRPRRGD